METIPCSISKFVEYTVNVEEKTQIVPFIEVNTFKSKGKEKADLVFNLKKRILKLKKRRNCFNNNADFGATRNKRCRLCMKYV